MNPQPVSRARGCAVAAALGLVLGCLLVPAASAGVVEIFVTTTEDELNADGDCSLREAIEAANTDAAVDACTAGDPSFDFIYPPPGATIALSQGPLLVSRALGIYADGLTLTVAGGADPQPLIVLDLGDEDFEFYGIWNGGHPRSVLSGGRNDGAGGAVHIATASDVALRDLVFSDNRAALGGAVGAGDDAALDMFSLDVVGSRFEDNHASGDGGAIGLGADGQGGLRNAVLRIGTSWFVGNTAGGNGGALAWTAQDAPDSSFGIQLQQLVFAGNSAAGAGGGLYLPSGPGGVLGTLQVIDNDAGEAGGALVGLPVLDLASSAFVRNAAGGAEGVANLVLTTAAPTIQLTAVSDAVLGRNCGFSGAPTQPAPNLGGEAGCGFELLGGAGYGPLRVHVEGVDELALPARGSPLIDAWEASACPTIWARDLFGRQRPLDGDGDGVAACDIGPVEVLDERVFASGFEPMAAR